MMPRGPRELAEIEAWTLKRSFPSATQCRKVRVVNMVESSCSECSRAAIYDVPPGVHDANPKRPLLYPSLAPLSRHIKSPWITSTLCYHWEILQLFETHDLVTHSPGCGGSPTSVNQCAQALIRCLCPNGWKTLCFSKSYVLSDFVVSLRKSTIGIAVRSC